MAFNPYTKQLYHPFWFDKEKAIFKRDGHACVICGFPNRDRRMYRYGDKKKRHLLVHFRQYLFSMVRNKYVEPWNYDDSLLKTYCNWCKEKGDNLWHTPIKKV